MKKYVLIVAGGKGLRMGNDLPKQFIPLQGRPVLMHTLERFYQWDPSACMILVLPEEHQDYWNMLCKELNCTIPHQIINGGENRFHSVKNGLSLITEPGLVAVHDGVRPFVSVEVIDSCFREAEIHQAAIPVSAVTDSVRKKTENGDTSPRDRDRYVTVQTPQVFNSRLLIDAYMLPYMPQFTDDASVVEAMGYQIHTVPGNRENIKITSPFDLLVAEAILNYQSSE